MHTSTNVAGGWILHLPAGRGEDGHPKLLPRQAPLHVLQTKRGSGPASEPTRTEWTAFRRWSRGPVRAELVLVTDCLLMAAFTMWRFRFRFISITEFRIRLGRSSSVG